MEEKIKIHRARKITDYSGYILSKDALQILKPSHIVRISYIDLTKEPCEGWTHDAPYLKIIEINGEDILGKICGLNRRRNVNSYPISTGERIWFKKENIIEIPIRYLPFTERPQFEKFKTDQKIPITGPLYTVEVPSKDEEDDHEYETETEGEENTDDETASDTDSG